MSRLSLGDVIFHENWDEGKYQVVSCLGGEDYKLRNIGTWEVVDWYYDSSLSGLQVEGSVPVDSVLHKVAFMNKRWGNRNA